MGEGETRIDYETALGFREKPIGPMAGLVEMNKRRRVSNVEGAEIEVFENEFVEGVLNGREGEEGFGEEKRGLRRVNAEY